MSYSVKIIADSIANGVRLTTMEATFPRFILAEFNTHRVFARNSASSRAIPVMRRIQQVWANPFVPEAFGKNQRGMQSEENLRGRGAALARFLWLLACRFCVLIAWLMVKLDVHKQYANRVIELWSWHTVIVTATEWTNFFNLRTHKAAQPEMQVIAKMMKEAYEAAMPTPRAPGEWHMPYLDPGETGDVSHFLAVSVARCAAVSYERQDVKKTPDEYQRRHGEGLKAGHMSPFEHQAKVATHEELRDHASWSVCNHPEAGEQLTVGFIGPFRAPWLQYRKTIPGEDVWTADLVPGPSTEAR